MTNADEDKAVRSELEGMFSEPAKSELVAFLNRRIKKVNETYGYCKGDERLECAGRIMELLELVWRVERESDTLEYEDELTDILNGVMK